MPDEIIEVIIATRNRLRKLQQTLKSLIKQNINLCIKICCDDDIITYNWCIDHKYEVYNYASHVGSVACRNFLSQKTIGSVIYSTDDIIFQPESIKIAINSLIERWPDTDGIIGFNQTGNTNKVPCKSGIALVGRKFMDRFPNRRMFCPKFFHFAAQEIQMIGEHYHRFYFNEQAIIHHLSPFKESRYMDKTHMDARIHKQCDHLLMQERKIKGLIWGVP